METLPLFLLAALTAALAAPLAVIIVEKRFARTGGQKGGHVDAATNDYTLLVRDGDIVDLSVGARVFHACLEGDVPIDWRSARLGLLRWLLDPPETLAPGFTGVVEARAGPPGVLTVAAEGNALRLCIKCPSAGAVDRLMANLTETELSRLKRVLDMSPGPIWILGPAGELAWNNHAYAELVADGRQFPNFDGYTDGALRTERLSLPGAVSTADTWFEVTSQRIGSDTLHVAINIDPVVRAEVAQRNFVQTLAKTFAHLPTGLAVFDRNRQLVLFNPALVDLTNLPAEFLASRPTIMTFFDQLREVRMMPEPRNYSGWREQIVDLVRAASDDRFSETWTLPTGLTYKITGRPHPDGAIAFLIEDISAEISLTRRFRAELAEAQSVLDTLEDGIAMFSGMGRLVRCNAAYRALWNRDDAEPAADPAISEACDRWAQQCSPTQAFLDLRRAAVQRETAQLNPFVVTHAKHGPIEVSMKGIGTGAYVVRFQMHRPPALLEKPRRAIGAL